MVANMSRRRRAPGRQHDHPAARQDQLPVERPHAQAQGAGGDHRLLARGVADQGRDPHPLSLERLFRRRCLRPARRRPPLFQPRPGASDAGPVGDARRPGQGAVAAGADPQSRRARRSAAGWCCSAMADTGVISRRARRARPRPARPVGARDEGPDRHLFRRLGRARPRRRRSRPTIGEVKVATTLDADLQRLAVRAVRRAGDRRRPGRAGRDAARRPGRRDGRRPQLQGKARSTARPRRGASRARRSSCSSISPRCAPAGRPTA